MVDHYLAEYGAYHTDRRNLICHEIGIPLIVLSIFALLELVRFGPIDLAMVAGVAVIIFYLMLDLKLALVALVSFALFYVIGRFVWWHHEGRSPAFLTNLIHLLVGPLWIVSLAVRRTKT